MYDLRGVHLNIGFDVKSSSLLSKYYDINVSAICLLNSPQGHIGGLIRSEFCYDLSPIHSILYILNS